jgi:hypothetical protein
MIARRGKFYKPMKYKAIVVISATLTLVACGPGKQSSTVEKPASTATKPVEMGPEYESIGVISSLEGRDLTLDHEGASGSGLAPGRNVFIAYADVLAEAPITPGSRVAFKFHRTSEGLELTALTQR